MVEEKIDKLILEGIENNKNNNNKNNLGQYFTTNLILKEKVFEFILNNPSNIDLDYTINTVMKVNKYLTTNLIIQFIYDDNSVKRLQVREVMGIGISLDI